jgi:response regulator RpfG family c-di-GMP phosphodiesterase
MKVNEIGVENIRVGALLHDIGKVGIPDSILLKPGKLTPKERTAMEMHPQLAYDLLSKASSLKRSLDIPYCHHEKWDGTGYPRGLMGERIPLAARLFSVVDTYDALTTSRPYREAMGNDGALEYIRSQSGEAFDPRVVEVFTQMFDDAEVV